MRRVEMAAATSLAEPQSAPSADTGAATLPALEAAQPDRYLIKNGFVELEVETPAVAKERLLASVQAVNGYISQMQENTATIGAWTMTVSIRLPATEFDRAKASFESIGRVLNSHVEVQDVTEEFVDTESRMRNLERTESRLLEHLERTSDLDSILRVETELTRVREQVERFQGRLRFLSDRVSYSTIQISMREAPKAQTILPEESYSIGKESSDAVRSLVAFLQVLLRKLIWLGVFSVVWLPPVLIFVWVIRRSIRNSKRRNSPPSLPKPPEAS